MLTICIHTHINTYCRKRKSRGIDLTATSSCKKKIQLDEHIKCSGREREGMTDHKYHA